MIEHMTSFRPGAALLAATLALLGPRTGVSQAPTVTLEEAVRRAQAVQPGVITAFGNVNTAEAQVRTTKLGAYLPNITATTTGTKSYSATPRLDQSTGRLTTTTTSLNMGLSASVDLFTGFRRGADSRAARAGLEAAEANLTNAQFQAGLGVTQQFFDALAAQQLVRVREAGVRRAEEQLSLSAAKLRVGSATRSDSLRSLVNLGNARLQLVSAESDVARTQAGLARLVGVEGRVEAADDSAFYVPTARLDTAALRLDALANSPRVQAAEASSNAADASVRAARAAYFPTLALSGDANWSGNSLDDYNLEGNQQLRLGLSWPLFNRFQREQTIQTRISSLNAAEATARDARREIEASLTTQFAALEAARVRIEITATSVEAATEDLRVVNERYRVGAATILDVLNSQEALAQAEVDAVTARFDFLNARAQIEALIGRRL
jgi:outer membrane protein TolC